MPRPLALAALGLGVALALVGAVTHLGVALAGAVLTALGAVVASVTGGSR